MRVSFIFFLFVSCQIRYLNFAGTCLHFQKVHLGQIIQLCRIANSFTYLADWTLSKSPVLVFPKSKFSISCFLSSCYMVCIYRSHSLVRFRESGFVRYTTIQVCKTFDSDSYGFIFQDGRNQSIEFWHYFAAQAIVCLNAFHSDCTRLYTAFYFAFESSWRLQQECPLSTHDSISACLWNWLAGMILQRIVLPRLTIQVLYVSETDWLGWFSEWLSSFDLRFKYGLSLGLIGWDGSVAVLLLHLRGGMSMTWK